MSGFFTNPFGGGAATTGQDEATSSSVQSTRTVARRRRASSFGEVEESPQTYAFHETFMFGPAAMEEPRRRRASSLGEVPEIVSMGEGQEATPDRPANFRNRTPSVVDARLNRLGRTRHRQGSVYGERRGSTAGVRRPSLAHVQRSRQPSAAWARQSSIVQEQLSQMTWTQAENMLGLTDTFYSDPEAQRQALRRSTIVDPEKFKARLAQDTAKQQEIDLEKGEKATDGHGYPIIEEPKDPARVLGRWNLRQQRLAFMCFVMFLNLGCLFGALFGGRHAGKFVLAFIIFVKSKDFLSCVLAMIYMPSRAIHRYFRPLPPVDGKWILTLIPAYSESEEQIVKTILSLRDNDVAPHEQVMVVMLDGKPRDVKNHMRIVKSFRRPYVTYKWKRGELLIDAGFIEDVPVIVFEKVKNAGKKDSLILAHDLFNVMRDNAPLYTKLLRDEIFKNLLPVLTANKTIPFTGFDYFFCTDADSIIHNGAVAALTNALIHDPNAIASCGLVLVELEKGAEWSVWNLYQQFQYTFGQYVRRRAEHIWGKVSW